MTNENNGENSDENSHETNDDFVDDDFPQTEGGNITPDVSGVSGVNEPAHDAETAAETAIASAEIHYPNGFGLSIEEVQALIAKVNQTIVAKDDPILLTVTILNAFLYENDKLNTKYNEALKAIYSEQTKNFVGDVSKNTERIVETLSSVSVEGMHKIHEDSTVKLSFFQTNMWWCTSIIAVSAILNVAVFILR